MVRRQEFDTEMEIKLASFEEEIDARKALLDQRETAINEQEDAVAQREQNLNLRLAELANKEESLVKKSDELREEEKWLSSERETLHMELQKEKEEIQNMKLDLEKEKSFFEEEKREAIQAQENLQILVLLSSTRRKHALHNVSDAAAYPHMIVLYSRRTENCLGVQRCGPHEHRLQLVIKHRVEQPVIVRTF